mgnify:CR=1 FL=1
MNRREQLIIGDLLTAVRRSEQVFRYHAVAFVRPRPLSLSPYRTALADLCVRLDRDASGLVGLDPLEAVLRGLCAGMAGDEVVREGERAMQTFVEWLARTFPSESGKVCRWPILKALFGRGDAKCEGCGRARAVVHTSAISAEGILMSDYCGRCHQAISGVEATSGRASA